MEKSKKNQQYVFILYLFFISTLIFLLYMYLSINDHFSPVELMLSQSNERPIVYRVFPALIAHGLAFLTGLPQSISAILVMYFSLIGFFIIYSRLARTLLPGINSYLTVLISAVLLVPFLFQNRYIYDFPILFIFCLAFYLLSKNQLTKYLVLFVVASLTKETSVLLILFYVMQYKKLPRKKFFSILFLQMFIYGIVRLALLLIFHNNPGSIVQYHLADHIQAYLGNPVGGVLLFVCVIGIFIMGFTDKSDHKILYRDALLTIGGPLVILYLLFGYPFEIRVFLEIFPILSLLLSSRIAVLKKHMMGHFDGADVKDVNRE